MVGGRAVKYGEGKIEKPIGLIKKKTTETGTVSRGPASRRRLRCRLNRPSFRFPLERSRNRSGQVVYR